MTTLAAFMCVACPQDSGKVGRVADVILLELAEGFPSHWNSSNYCNVQESLALLEIMEVDGMASWMTMFLHKEVVHST